MFSVAVQQAALKMRLNRFSICDPSSLRAINCVGVIFVSYLALLCRQAIEGRLHEARSAARVRAFSQYALHTAVNIGLFPLLFFFSGLYYTDVLSTVMVLCSFLNHLRRVATDVPSVLNDLLTIVLGIATLFMRQTNVFWVVVFMGGLEVVHAVKTVRPKLVEQPEATTLFGRLQFYVVRYSIGDIHDLPLHKAYPDGACLYQ
jgi:alpha-1,2-glucosyltransferase